ncbi:MAG: PDZ domain-containing protein [Nitrospirae bacterium]|nr:PDZ domain-containing protein [Nitrospirota bacterium]MBF0534369.1 PDZ domain-containing protein [Nitrospirota bacterium]MBF0615650.1 PDZ domain-containing protein [Nitrospirota bacterium]
MKNLWKSINFILVLLIVVTAGYLLIFSPEKFMGKERNEEELIKNVRQNAVSPALAALNRPVNRQGDLMDPNAVPGANNYGPAYNNQSAPSDTQGTDSAKPAVGWQVDPKDMFWTVNPDNSTTTQTTPSAVNAALLEKILQEGHWIGLEAVPLTPQLAQANGIPQNVTGVLIDEVTLLAAASGIYAGDVISAVNDVPVSDLHSFKAATAAIAMKNEAVVTVYRKNGDIKIPVKSSEALGVAQMEAAPMIFSTSRSPHGYYGPCDKCHSISKSAKNTSTLGMDAGDALPIPPPSIKWGTPCPHRNRGLCTNCHKII